MREIDVICMRGIARKAKGDLDGALADYDETIRLDLTYPEVLELRDEARKARKPNF